MKKVFVPLEIDESDALRIWAQREKRDPRLHAAYLIRTALEDAGYLQPLTLPISRLPQETANVTNS